MLSKLSNEDVRACGRETHQAKSCDGRDAVWCGTDTIFIVGQLQEKHLIANKPLYMAFVYLEKKAFDCVHQDFIWLAMVMLGTEDWLVHLVQSMYKDVRSLVRVGDGYCQ